MINQGLPHHLEKELSLKQKKSNPAGIASTEMLRTRVSVHEEPDDLSSGALKTAQGSREGTASTVSKNKRHRTYDNSY